MPLLVFVGGDDTSGSVTAPSAGAAAGSSGPTILDQIEALVQQGRAVVGSLLGLPYNVYRLASNGDPSVLTDPPVETITAKLDRAARKDIEASIGELEVFVAKCNNQTLAFGDVFVGTDHRDLATYVYAQYRALEPTLWIRTQYVGTITRPIPEAPVSGRASYPVEGVEFSNALQLFNGQYQFGSGEAAQIPIAGIMGRLRDVPRSDDSAIGLDDDVRRVIWNFYILPLPGTTLQIRDVIHIPEGDFSIVAFQDNPVGFFGYLIMGERNR